MYKRQPPHRLALLAAAAAALAAADRKHAEHDGAAGPGDDQRHEVAHFFRLFDLVLDLVLCALVGLALIVGLVALIWHVTSIHMEIKGRDEVEGAEGTVEDKVSSAKQAREDFARVS